MSGTAGRRLIRLHLGASDQAVDGWLNTDITPHLFVARVPFLARTLGALGLITPQQLEQHRRGVFRKLHYLDLTKPLPFRDATCEAVFSSHVLEHLFLDEAKALLSELARVLCPGGVCRIVVPDLARAVAAFDPLNPEPFLEAMFETGKRSAARHSHHSGYTGEYLTRLLTAAGFSSAYVTEYRKGRCPDLERLDNRPSSLFVEAVR